MQSGATQIYEEYATGAMGKITTFLSTKGPLLNSENEIIGIFGIARDITEMAEIASRLVPDR